MTPNVRRAAKTWDEKIAFRKDTTGPIRARVGETRMARMVDEITDDRLEREAIWAFGLSTSSCLTRTKYEGSARKAIVAVT